MLFVASFLFLGIGVMTSVLPLISPEKGTQLGFIAQGTLLVVSGVYYPVSVLPDDGVARGHLAGDVSLEGCREAILDGAGVSEMWDELVPLAIIGAVSIPLRLWVFGGSEIYA